MEKTSSAQRLLKILSGPTKEKKTVGDQWITAFGISEHGFVQIAQCHAKVCQLAVHVREQVNGLEDVDDDDIKHYLKPVEKIIHVLNMTPPQTSWADFRTKITDAVLSELRHVGTALKMQYPEYQLERALLDEAVQKTKDLRAQIELTDLPVDVKRRIHELLDQVETSIRECHATGNEGVREKLDQLVGYVFSESVRNQALAKFRKAIIIAVLSIGGTINFANSAFDFKAHVEELFTPVHNEQTLQDLKALGPPAKISPEK